MWPPYRDYTMELRNIFKQIHKYKDAVKKNKLSIETMEMAQLMNAELQLKKLIDDFEFTALKVVNIIVHWKPDTVHLGSMYGKGGRKWVAGGLLVRECKN